MEKKKIKPHGFLLNPPETSSSKVCKPSKSNAVVHQIVTQETECGFNKVVDPIREEFRTIRQQDCSLKNLIHHPELLSNELVVTNMFDQTQLADFAAKEWEKGLNPDTYKEQKDKPISEKTAL